MSHETKSPLSLKSVCKPDMGFTVKIPKDWAEFPPLLSNSAYEVARFAYRDHTNHLCIVFRMPGSPGLDPMVTAAEAKKKLAAQGFQNFALARVDVAKRAGVALTFDKATEHGVWAGREYFVGAGSIVFCLGLGTGDPITDGAWFDAMADGFEVTD